MRKTIFSLMVVEILVLGFPVFTARAKQIYQEVMVVNDSTSPIPVAVMNLPAPLPTEIPTATPTPTIQLWEHWYQCHPNPTNEAEIRGYINDRGREGWEVVAAASPNGLICEYYKRPLQ